MGIDFPFRCFVLPRPPISLLVGRKKGADIIIADEHISAEHLTITLGYDCFGRDIRINISVLGRNGVYVNNEFADKDTCQPLREGSIIRCCRVILCISRYHIFIADENEIYDYGKKSAINKCMYRCSFVEVDPFELLKSVKMDNTIYSLFKPVPRSTPDIDYSPIELEAPPSRKNPEKQSIILAAGPALTMAIPILLGAGKKIMIISGIIAALWAALNVMTRRKKNRKEEKLRRSAYSRYAAECEEVIDGRIRNIRNALMTMYPDTKEYLKGGGNPHLLWNRDSKEPDYGCLRLGVGEEDMPVEIKVPKDKFTVIEDSLTKLPNEIKNKYVKIHDVPVCVDIFSDGPFALIDGEEEDRNEILRALIFKLCAAYKPGELKIAILMENFCDAYEYAFLPHTWQGSESYIAVAKDNYIRVCELIEKADNEKIIIFLDDISYFIRLNERAGDVIVYSAASFNDIPPGIMTVMLHDAAFEGLLFMGAMRRGRREFTFDRISQEKFAPYIIKISSFFSHVYSGKKPVPDEVLLTELIGNDNLNSDAVIAAWDLSSKSRSLSAPLGKAKDDEVIYLDADERGCGPHGLIAGTTGSGKSELLQTLILSLAYYYPPWRISFFLIDYKGGGMANMFADLPHLAGSISNLSGAVSERAMVSIKSENILRQRMFAEHKVNNIHDYEALYEKGEAAEPLPHIFIIIDEFAELKKEEPEFMQQLISVAQVGRSLGVHLILSTQKPAGCVDDKIWSNSRFRICLKVRDKADSMDMLHTKDAAYITNVGRAYLQVGNDEIYTQFQCAYTMAPVTKKSEESVFTIFDENFIRTGWEALGCAAKDPGNIRHKDIDNENIPTQMQLIKELIKEAADKSKKPGMHRLWLNELPPLLPPGPFVKSCIENQASGIPIGIYDDPARQLQKEVFYAPALWGNTMLIGLPGSGKSTLLLRILLGMIATSDTADTGLYIIDCGGRRLSPFAKSRLCGGYISFEEGEQIPKLIGFIKEEAAVRRLMAGQACDAADKRPDILVVIDNFGSMLSLANDDIVADIIEVIRDGGGLGIRFLISANMAAAGELPVKLAALFDSAIALSQRDKYAYSGIFALPPSSIPAIDPIPGRGLIRIEKQVYAFQAYIPINDKEEKWKDLIADLAEDANSRMSGKCRMYPFIPKDPRFTDFAAQCAASYNKEEIPASCIPIGYESESGHIYSLPLSGLGTVLIIGRRRSGRKTTLRVIEKMALLRGIRTFHFTTFHELSEILKNNDSGIALCECLKEAFSEFYENSYDKALEEELSRYVSDMAYEEENTPVKIIFVMDIKDRSRFLGRRLFSVLLEHPYVIALGGVVSEYSYFDFGNVPFSQASKRKSPGRGDVAFYDEEIFSGGVVIPRLE